MEQKEALRELQDADLIILRAKTRYDSLPEKRQLAEVREKIHAALLRSGQVSDLKSECEDALQKWQDEDDRLKEKIADNQAKLDETSNHRLISGLTKEMEGSVKRREKVDFQMGECLERLEKIEEVETKVKAACKKLDTAEKQLETSIRMQGEQMKREITDAQAKRKAAAAQLDRKLLERYMHIARIKNGIGMAVYENARCSACNVEFNEGERQHIENGPEIGTCPRCGRLLIHGVGKEDTR